MGKHGVLVWDRIFGGGGKKRGRAGKDWEWDILRGLGRIFGGPRAVEPVGKVGKEGGGRARKLLAAWRRTAAESWRQNQGDWGDLPPSCLGGPPLQPPHIVLIQPPLDDQEMPWAFV